ncbi:MAG: HAMP domain-containing sensor histidine kinase [Gemmatimonadota bacterium]
MTVRVRLLLTLGGIILLLVIPAAYGVSQLQRLRDIAVELENVHADDILAVGQYRAALAELDRLLGIYVANESDEALSGVDRELSAARSNLQPLRPAYSDAVDPTLAFLDSLDTARDRIEDLMRTDQFDSATNYFAGTVSPLLDSARLSVFPLRRAVDEQGRNRVAQARQVSSAAARTTLLAATIAVLLTAALGLWTTGALSRPLRRLSEATGAVARGEFSAPPDLPYDRDDEIGDLSRSFQSMTAQLAELDRLKAEFVSLASHELKTPINVIGGYAELLEEGLYGEVSERQREVLSLVRDQTRSLTLLVNQLLDLSRFESGGLRVEPREVELGGLLEQVEGSFRALATQKQIAFDVQRESSLPSRAILDPDRIRHEVLGNLLSNAFKFTGSGGTIRLRAWRESEFIRLTVTDDGVGIPQDQLEHVFEKYYQVEGEAKDMGSGLGLAIAKHVVDAHGGTISAASVVGQGTRFEIRLPLSNGEGRPG